MLAQPLILRYFIIWLQDRSANVRDGLLLAMGLMLVSLAQAVVHHALYFITMRMGWNLRIGMSGVLHWKLLRLASSTVSAFGPGKVINLISTDVLRFELFSTTLHFTWSTFFDLGVTVGLTVFAVGRSAASWLHDLWI